MTGLGGEDNVLHLIEVDPHRSKCATGSHVEVDALSAKTPVNMAMDVGTDLLSPNRVSGPSVLCLVRTPLAGL